jgi:cell division protein FtsN
VSGGGDKSREAGGPVREADEGDGLDLKLLDSLYRDDLDDAEPGARRVRDELDTLDAASGEAGSEESGGAQELARLRQLRGMFAELRANQEEPPPEGMAFLLAAARQAAEERKAAAEPAGLWARLRAGWQAMLAHPGMAAAVAAVVVIGASGYLMSRGMLKQADQTYSSEEQLEEMSRRVDELERQRQGAAAPAEPAAPRAASEPMPEPMIVTPADVDLGASSGARGAGSGEPRMQPAPSAAKGGTGGGLGGPVVQPRKPAKGEKVTGEETLSIGDGRAEGRYGSGAGGKAPGGAGTSAGVGKDVARDAIDDNFSRQNADASGTPAAGPAATAAPEAPPPPPPASPVTAKPAPKKPAEADRSETAGAPAELAEDEEAPKPSKPSRVESVSQQAERWYKLALSEAAKGNCEQVRLLAKRVRSEDAVFYETRFLKEPSLKKCL